jgi:HAMP domain-containing protein
MRWFKVAAVGVGILIALIIGWAVVGFVLHAVEFLVIAALVVGAVAVAIKVARSGKQISRKRAKREVREPDYNQSLPRADVEHVTTPYPSQPPRQSAPDIDEELARLKREMGS